VVHTTFEFRLEGGKVFHIGYLPPGERGGLTVTHVPDFCRPPQFPASVCEGGKGTWYIGALDEHARRSILTDSQRGCRSLELSDARPGVGIVSLSDYRVPFNLDVYLSTREISAGGLSLCEDWMRIVKAAKDDLNVEALLRLDLGEVTPQEIECFSTGRNLASSDIELVVQPRLVQWSRDD
jgi:hypothetical protein